MLFDLSDTPADGDFPDPELAEREPNGLLAVGGDLSVPRLLQAYATGLFPWYNAGQPILWWSPDPRMVLYPEALHVSRSLRRHLRREPLTIRFNGAFPSVIQACAEARSDGEGTWLTAEMINAYTQLQAAGYAHSVETWRGGSLVGGLYGVAFGGVFFGESMFSRESNASKCALVGLSHALLADGYGLIDCQVFTPHLAALGAVEIPRRLFRQHLGAAVMQHGRNAWSAPEVGMPTAELVNNDG